MTRSLASAHAQVSLQGQCPPADSVATNQTPWHRSAPTATRKRLRGALRAQTSQRNESHFARGRSSEQQSHYYPDGLKADLTAVRPINLCDSILGVCVLCVCMRSKTDNAKGMQDKKLRKEVVPEAVCASQERGAGRQAAAASRSLLGKCYGRSAALKKCPQLLRPTVHAQRTRTARARDWPGLLTWACCKAAKFQVPACGTLAGLSILSIASIQLRISRQFPHFSGSPVTGGIFFGSWLVPRKREAWSGTESSTHQGRKQDSNIEMVLLAH